MRRPPRDPKGPILDRRLVLRTVTVGVLMAAGAIGLLAWEYRQSLASGMTADGALARAQTMAVTTVILFQVYYLFTCRALRDSIFAIGLFSRPAVFAGVIAVLALQAGFVFLPAMQAVFHTTPLGAQGLALAAASAAVVLPVVSLLKRLEARGTRQGTRWVVSPSA